MWTQTMANENHVPRSLLHKQHLPEAMIESQTTVVCGNYGSMSSSYEPDAYDLRAGEVALLSPGSCSFESYRMHKPCGCVRVLEIKDLDMACSMS